MNYLKEEGPQHWNGNLFVFDSRMSVHPAEISLAASPKARLLQSGPEADCRARSAAGVTPSQQEEAAAGGPWASCRICGASATEKRHRNCANADCNMLFL